MGCDPSESGVTVKFLNKDGSPDTSRPTIFGAACKFYSKKRPHAFAGNDPANGSEDWFTEVLIASDPASLNDLPHSTSSEALSSAASREVCLRWNTTDVSGARSKGELRNLTTMGIGYSKPGARSDSPTRLNVEELLVMPGDTEVNGSHPLGHVWNDLTAMRFKVPPPNALHHKTAERK